MTKQVLSMLLASAAAAFGSVAARAQPSRASVSAGEVNGTFRYNYTGKFKGSYNEIRILALGRGKLKMEFGLTYPYIDGTGGLSANVGEDRGTAEIVGDTAIFTSDQGPECRIEIRFVRPGTIKVTHRSGLLSCGYGHNVSAEGTYRKVSGRKPKFQAGL